MPESTIRSILKKYNATSNVENFHKSWKTKESNMTRWVYVVDVVKKNRGKVLREITNDLNEEDALVFTQTLCSVICTKTKYIDASYVNIWLRGK